MLETMVFSTLNGILYGLLLFILSSGLTLIFSLIFCLYLNMHNMSINIIFVFKKFHGIKKRNSKFETVFLKKFYNLYVI